MKSTDVSTNKKNKLNPTDGIKARMKENYKMASPLRKARLKPYAQCNYIVGSNPVFEK